jgi:hypothetical protein
MAGRERDAAEGDAFDVGEAVVDGEAFVEVGEIGVDEVAGGEIGAEHFLEVEVGLGDGGFDERIVEVVVVVERGGGGGVLDFPEVEPVIEEGLAEAGGARIGEQALGLGAEDLGADEFAAVGAGAEGGVGRRVPEEEGEAVARRERRNRGRRGRRCRRRPWPR